jgi:hypothetical protein
VSIEAKLARFENSFPIAKDVFESFIDLQAPNFQWINAVTGEVVMDGRETFAAFSAQFEAENPHVTIESTPIVRIGNVASHIEVFSNLADGSTVTCAWTYIIEGDAIVRQYGIQIIK